MTDLNFNTVELMDYIDSVISYDPISNRVRLEHYKNMESFKYFIDKYGKENFLQITNELMDVIFDYKLNRSNIIYSEVS